MQIDGLGFCLNSKNFIGAFLTTITFLKNNLLQLLPFMVPRKPSKSIETILRFKGLLQRGRKPIFNP